MSGMVKGRMLRPLCHSHSAATASASDLVGIASGTRSPGSTLHPWQWNLIFEHLQGSARSFSFSEARQMG